MKKTIVILFSCVALAGCDRAPQGEVPNSTEPVQSGQIPADLTDREEAFLAEVREAFETGDSSALVERICWDGVLQSLRSFFDDLIVDGVGRGLKSLEFKRVDPKTMTERIEDGTAVVANLPVQWVMTVHHPSEENAKFTSNYLLGEKDGVIQFTNSIVK